MYIADLINVHTTSKGRGGGGEGDNKDFKGGVVRGAYTSVLRAPIKWSRVV